MRLNMVFKMLQSEPDFRASYLPVSYSQICCSQGRKLTLMCTNNFIGNSVFSSCCSRASSNKDYEVSHGLNLVLMYSIDLEIEKISHIFFTFYCYLYCTFIKTIDHTHQP